MFGFFRKHQKPKDCEKKDDDFSKFCEEHAEALDYPDVPDVKRHYRLDDSHLPEHLRKRVDKKKSV